VLLVDDEVIKVYDAAVGAPSTPSPVGEFRIVTRIAHPTWYTPGKVVPPGKNNPLGTRWLGLSASGYGIHGTNAPSSIGNAASHGCIRMRNRDVEELFELVDVGVRVIVTAD
jgi:L,D-transpeptidase ErfK/SrfK